MWSNNTFFPLLIYVDNISEMLYSSDLQIIYSHLSSQWSRKCVCTNLYCLFIISLRTFTSAFSPCYQSHKNLNVNIWTARHLLQIEAREVSTKSSLSTSAQVIVYIRDQNDNSPVFSETIYRAELTENATAGARVIQVGDFARYIFIWNLYHMATNGQEVLAACVRIELHHSSGSTEDVLWRTQRE